MSGASRPGLRPETAWPWAIVAVLVVTVAANVVLLVQASQPNAASVEPDYYRRALAWDSTQAARSRSAALGWRADAGFAAPGRTGTPLVVTLADSLGAVVGGATVSVEAVHNLDPEHPGRWRLAEWGPGRYGCVVRLSHAGRWELRVAATRGGERYVGVLHADAPPGPVR